MSEEFKETNSGIKKEGNWREVAEFGEEVEEAMEDEMDEKTVEEFEEWRPKTEEAENDMKKKTVDKAKLDRKKMEEKSNGVRKDLKSASGEIAKAGKKAAKKEAPRKEVTEASEEVARPFYSKAAKLFRTLEGLVYSKISLRSNPYYFDSEKMSATFRSGKRDYEMEVNVPEKKAREDMKEKLE